MNLELGIAAARQRGTTNWRLRAALAAAGVTRPAKAKHWRISTEIIDRALTLYPNARVAFLLRLNFAGSEERSAFMRARPPSVYVLPNRPAFRDGQTDSCEYAWFVWPRGDLRERDRGHFMVLAPTPAAERERKLVARGRTFEVAQGDLFKTPELGIAAQRQGRAQDACRPPNACGVDGAAAIPHSENGGNPAMGTETRTENGHRGDVRRETVESAMPCEAVTGGRDPQLFGSNEQPQQRGENAGT